MPLDANYPALHSSPTNLRVSSTTDFHDEKERPLPDRGTFALKRNTVGAG